MEVMGDIEQFDVLEEKIDSLLSLVENLKNENRSLSERVQIQEEKIADLSRQVEALKSGRDKAKQKILQLLEKLEQVELE
ncbi:MAG: cell division protein ZapB [Deltaproteobacteria bacterium]|nr:cell division protein ZapB [Deltaproteobacteria bacterium]MBW2082465.1 cell division protein ZapB [Deltaproteobacteria bacterium]